MSGTVTNEEPFVGAEAEDAPVPDNPVASIGRARLFDDEPESDLDRIIREIVGIERGMFFEKRHSKAERQRRIREVIERHTKLEKA